ncbi:LuxR C-terminal-related transcriptional regulator [Kribbella sp. NPDC051586]|uniref:helix-turn-helix transcriptional regulator n=1 Tax=Kribbella sp. NPDC051586 TaxID=3364118 RepID=UPI0037BBE644
MLDGFGLTGQEKVLYDYLLSRPPVLESDIDRIADREGWDEPVDAALEMLQSLGLVARIPASPPRYAAVEPEPALDALLSARERDLSEARRRVTELATRFHGRRPGQELDRLIDVIYGHEAIARVSQELQRGAVSGLCVSDVPPYVSFGPDVEAHPINCLELELLGKGIEYRVLYHPLGLDRPGRLADLQAGLAAGEQARVTEVPIKLLLSDKPAALLPLHRNPVDLASALLIEDSTLLEALREMFELYWSRAIPLRVRGGGQPSHPDGSDRPTPTESCLLPLLVGGLSDSAIARQLGWSERTVGRYLQAMMLKLDVQTRFQAGYEAVRKGWLGDG